MSHTPEELRAMEKDILAGLVEINRILAGMHQAIPLAVSQLNPHATGTRKLLKASADLYETGVEITSVITWFKEHGVPLKKVGKE